MASGPRAYGVAVERKLYRVARGTCYYPGCKRAIMVDIDDEPVCDVEIAHIRGAEPNSARHDETMSDDERRAFANLILLCSAHHKLVDRIKPDDYPVELLKQWKADNEDRELATLVGGLDEETLIEALSAAAANLRPRREVVVELACGLLLPGGQLITSPNVATQQRTITSNPGWDAFPRVLVTTIRNTGALDVEIEGVDICFPMAPLDDTGQDAATPEVARLSGQDDFPGQNPRLPHRMADGSATHWLTKTWHLDYMTAVGEYNGRPILTIHSQVQLATGEHITSPPLSLAPADDH